MIGSEIGRFQAGKAAGKAQEVSEVSAVGTQGVLVGLQVDPVSRLTPVSKII